MEINLPLLIKFGKDREEGLIQFPYCSLYGFRQLVNTGATAAARKRIVAKEGQVTWRESLDSFIAKWKCARHFKLLGCVISTTLLIS
jgi:hypothetical protein